MKAPAPYLRAQPPNFVAGAPLATTNAQGIHPRVCRYTFHLVFVLTVASESCVDLVLIRVLSLLRTSKRAARV